MAVESSESEQLPLLAAAGTAKPNSKSFFPARYALAILLFFGFANVYALRVNLSMAIVAMTHQPKDPPGVSRRQCNYIIILTV